LNFRPGDGAAGRLRMMRRMTLSIDGGPSAAAGAESAVPWWLWWNILSVDAPMVAVAWAAVFGGARGGTLPVVDAVVLFLAVWIIYIADRVLDGWAATNNEELRERHYFCERHCAGLVTLLGLAGGVIFWLTTEYLPAAEQNAGLILGAVVILYLAGIYAVRERFTRIVPKEIAVGTLFAVGVTLPRWSQGAQLSWHAAVLLVFFALLCCLNCLSIECWEHRSDSGSSAAIAHRLAAWPDMRLSKLAAMLAGLAFVGCLLQGLSGFFGFEWLAICFGALLLLILNLNRKTFSPEALRVLADLALLLPALFVLAIR
jgi:hypothetical protein